MTNNSPCSQVWTKCPDSWHSCKRPTLLGMPGKYFLSTRQVSAKQSLANDQKIFLLKKFSIKCDQQPLSCRIYRNFTLSACKSFIVKVFLESGLDFISLLLGLQVNNRHSQHFLIKKKLRFREGNCHVQVT